MPELGDAVGDSPRKPCGCGSPDKKQASNLLASIYGKPFEESAEVTPHSDRAGGMRAWLDKTTCGDNAAGGPLLPRHASTLLKDGLRLLQNVAMASAIILYYLIFSYVQLVYIVLSSLLYFHNADGPMKATIAVVVATAMLILYHSFYKLERLFGR